MMREFRFTLMFSDRDCAIVKRRICGLFVQQSSLLKANMLQRLSDDVRESYARAKDCARKAAAQSEPAVRQSFLDAEQCWLRLLKRLAALPELERD
jgi:hypothetical protein